MTVKSHLSQASSSWHICLACDDCGAETHCEVGTRQYDAYALRRLAADATRLGWRVRDDYGVSSWCPRCMGRKLA